jgi:hypothetical protein
VGASIITIRAPAGTVAAAEGRDGAECGPRKAQVARVAAIAISFGILLTGCGASGNANAELGPNPGGGYFGANVNVGTVNPSKVYDGI